MSEPVRELDAAVTQLADRWDTQRTERTLYALHQKRRRRQQRQRVLVGVGALATLGTLLLVTLREPAARAPELPGSRPQAAASALHLQLADGSEVALRDERSRVQVHEASRSRVSVELLAGQARFEVLHREERVFRVRSGEVSVEVLGTAFEVEREATRSRVVVLRGRVAVTWSTGRTELAAGEAGWFPRAAESDETKLSETPPIAPKHAPRKPAKAAPGAWREPAEQGDFEHAYELLAQVQQPVADNVEELLLAADTARLSGHPQAALAFFQQVIERHAHDSRAGLAAFTLGGVLMLQLGQPREAEAAYARARALSLNASLAQDALARQVEAAHRAGDAAHARALANEYLARYPKGRRVHAVQRFGGLEP
jgi:transmembrane sensor